MRIERFGQASKHVEHGTGASILFSYRTPVAAFIPGRGYIKTEKYYSRTTNSHISCWIRSEATIVPQSEIDKLVREERHV